MSILYALGTAMTAYIVIYTIMLVIGVIYFFLLLRDFLKDWRKEEKAFKRNVSYIHKRQREMKEWSRKFQERRETKYKGRG